jgi:hypothetical protein
VPNDIPRLDVHLDEPSDGNGPGANGSDNTGTNDTIDVRSDTFFWDNLAGDSEFKKRVFRAFDYWRTGLIPEIPWGMFRNPDRYFPQDPPLRGQITEGERRPPTMGASPITDYEELVIHVPDGRAIVMPGIGRARVVPTPGRGRPVWSEDAIPRPLEPGAGPGTSGTHGRGQMSGLAVGTMAGGTLANPGGTGGGGEGTLSPGGGGASQKGGEDEGRRRNDYQGGGRDHDPRPRSSDNRDYNVTGDGGNEPQDGDEGGGDGDENGGNNGGGNGDDTHQGGGTGDWGSGGDEYVPANHELQERLRDKLERQSNSGGNGLPPAEEGDGPRGNDLGARGKLPQGAPGVTYQQRDLVGSAFGTTTGPDDKDRPNTGGTTNRNTSDPNNDLGDDLPGRRLGGQGGEPGPSFRELFYLWPGVDPEIAH